MILSRRFFLNSLIVAPPLLAERQTGSAVVMRLADRKILHIENSDFAARAVLPPASSIKPFALLALMEAGQLRGNDLFACSGRLQIKGHSLNCIHPRMPVPMNPARALAYSCNGAVAHFADRFMVNELPQSLMSFGFTSQTGLLKLPEATGRVELETVGASCQLQALGEEGVAVTPLELLLGYARLSQRVQEAKYLPIRDGLEGAVEFGTAQAARLDGVQVAGKTGSIVLRSGYPAAWFAGFAPSRQPRVVVVVVTPGQSGGADAAPIAAGLLKRFLSA
jgi:cell division protein FtsI/penicillin-binding protein 2